MGSLKKRQRRQYFVKFVFEEKQLDWLLKKKMKYSGTYFSWGICRFLKGNRNGLTSVAQLVELDHKVKG